MYTPWMLRAYGDAQLDPVALPPGFLFAKRSKGKYDDGEQ
jgi:hypothetical protein